MDQSEDEIKRSREVIFVCFSVAGSRFAFLLRAFEKRLVLCHRSKTELLQGAREGRKRKERKARRPASARERQRPPERAEGAAEEKSSAREKKTENRRV